MCTLWLNANKGPLHPSESLFIFENEDWQIIISHRLNPPNTSWWPLQDDPEQGRGSVDDRVCRWLSLTAGTISCPRPAGILSPSGRHLTSIFICTKRQSLTPFIRIMSEDARNNEIGIFGEMASLPNHSIWSILHSVSSKLEGARWQTYLASWQSLPIPVLN